MTNAFQELSNGIAEIIEAVSPAVVRVEGRRRFASSGVVWSGEGLIITAHHTVERDEDIQVGLIDGRVLPATVIGRDSRTDLALLKVDEALPTAQWDNAEALKVGNLVLALARPLGDIQASCGIVRAIHEEGFPRGPQRGGPRGKWGKGERGGPPQGGPFGGPKGGPFSGGDPFGGGPFGPPQGGPFGGPPHRGRGGRGGRHFGPPHIAMGLSPFIHADITLYPGFSGGPLLDSSGAIRGINTSGMFRNTNLLIPTNTINSTVEALLSHGRVNRPYLGVTVQPVRIAETQQAIAEQRKGLIVLSAEADSPSGQAGLLQGDILLSLNETTLNSVDDLMHSISSYGAGAEARLRLLRGGEVLQVTTTIGERG
jgi:S1-C subfamily serine protease